eukprot:735781-Pyramimonas_sp.AAC.1
MHNLGFLHRSLAPAQTLFCEAVKVKYLRQEIIAHISSGCNFVLGVIDAIKCRIGANGRLIY